MRLVDADALSKSVLEWLPSDPCGRQESEYPFETDICISMLQEIEEAPTIDAEPKTGWIPVSERLPKEYAQYLVCFENGECFVYWLEDSDWSRSVAEKEGILAWMPLPMPYREDGE